MAGTRPDGDRNFLSPSPNMFQRSPQTLRRMASDSSLNSESPYTVSAVPGQAPSLAPSISEKYSLPTDPQELGHNVHMDFREPDDHLHNPDPKRDLHHDAGGSFLTPRGMTNLGCLALLIVGLLILFAGYPLITHFTKQGLSLQNGFNFGGTNATGQVPDMGNFGLIDKDTPKSAYTKQPYTAGGSDWQLVFSDEFNVEGRSFYPGDDPYWEAVDLHYWGTNNMEWYDPAAITTRNGSLAITLSKKETHGLNYEGGMMSTWNKFCFTGGLIEANVMLPGHNNVLGLWPAVWTMGNLGRAGYGASLDGTWPYTYDSCDVGTVANQSVNGLPVDAVTKGDKYNKNILSFQPGQRLSRCTCPNESHPGPVHADGTYVGRAAPEIDIFEAQVAGDPLEGEVSQSCQWAPFNSEYAWFNTSDNLIIHNEAGTTFNTYVGGVYQQATSSVTITNQECYELTGKCYSLYGFEYKPGFDNAYITWISDGKAVWTLKSDGMKADTRVEIGPRPVPVEPMYIIVNLGMSKNFGFVDEEHLVFPTTMYVDYIRVYQPTDAVNIGCDPSDFPTRAYINEYIEAYTNPNLTTWVDDYKQPIPKNSFLGQC